MMFPNSGYHHGTEIILAITLDLTPGNRSGSCPGRFRGLYWEVFWDLPGNVENEPK